ncbi:sensor domain-containing diguanylate cyclase [Psychrobium sp. 1_MG-2023]|uniref:sensor domain-containing diguanylate cyclase n=1 Tax=Psychrobium sp. 1_MG-2023 TaxID=3062624 RepID=UPI000C34C7F0|nr:sensor domain-containing diguanylate cyclase [Psychrobium sp. 1_MG-2023]MDP2559609.1 diguanylate cyclase [Psychrobium sp. 1_MG-2023]PKF59443.1 hypothetical protein CW748_01335 [Alteromonadales bacterium alter-6D02]
MDKKFSELEQSIYRLFEITPIPIVLSYPDGRLEYVNPALKAMLGYDEEFIFSDQVIITHPDDIELNKAIRVLLQQDPFTPIQREKRYLHADGHTVYAQLNIVAQPNDAGVIKRYISQLIDLTAIKKAESSEILLNHLVKQSNDAIYVVSPSYGEILNCNHLAYKRLGYSKDELLRMTVSDIHLSFREPELWQQHVEKIKKRQSLVIESTHTRSDGTSFPVEANISYILYNDTGYLLAIVRDISRRKQKEREALELANLDPLTRLPNRNILKIRLGELIEKADQKRTFMAFLFIDLDLFKQINDTYGHAVGDGVLTGAANRLKNCVRKSDLVTRLGGDEFLIVLGGLEKEEFIEQMANKILAEFSSPFKIQSQLIDVAASIGISIYHNNNADPQTLIQLADEAMYQAKKSTGNSIYYI